MTLEAVVFPQDLFSQTHTDLYSIGEEAWSYESGIGLDGDPNSSQPTSSFIQNFEDWHVNSSSKDGVQLSETLPVGEESVPEAKGRRKRRRTPTCKNKEEVENQRTTHIAVERNRRRQMNEYLAEIRSLMPSSYVQRGDQASVIGGAINFVKELEQLVQSLEARKSDTRHSSGATPLAGFLTFPQYTSCQYSSATTSSNELVAENRSVLADIEVNKVENHANLKVLSRQRPKQLLRMVVGLHGLHLTALHLNVTTVDGMVLYSFSLKVEDDCHLTSADEIATAIYQILHKIQQDSELLAEQ